jgi:hypothetical protein
MYDYGNARVAALRGRLLDERAVRQLAEAPDAFAFLALLGRHEDWRTVVREVAPLGSEPGAAAEAAIERHRGERLGLLPRWYEGAARSLVEALVLGLDLERALAVLRRRRGGEPADSIGTSIVRGALLDAVSLGRLARAGGPDAAMKVLAASGVVEQADRAPLAEAAGDRSRPEVFEAILIAASDRARDRRAGGLGTEAARVRRALERERADRAAVARELQENGAVAASLAERSLALARFDDLARDAWRDPLGIGAVAGYIGAVEAQAVRLRAVLARVRSRWSAEMLGVYLDRSGSRRWRVSSS